MSQPHFSNLAQSYAEELTPQQLEYLIEFSDEIETPFRFFSQTHAPEKLSLQGALDVIRAAPAALKKKSKDHDKPSAAEKIWHEELASEFPTAEEREGRRLPAILAISEFERLLAAAQRKERDYLILRTFYATAMRISEVEALRVGDLYLPELKAFIRDGKNDTDRYVLLDPLTAELLDKFTYGRGPQDQVFEIEARQITRVVKRYAKETGIADRYTAIGRNFAPHSLRHTCATHLYEAGMDLFTLQQILGHRFLDTTRTYVHIGINRLRTSYQAFHPFCQDDKEPT